MLRLKPDQPVDAGTATLRGLQPEILGVRRRAAPNSEPFTLGAGRPARHSRFGDQSGLRQSYERPLFTIAIVALSCC